MGKTMRDLGRSLMRGACGNATYCARLSLGFLAMILAQVWYGERLGDVVHPALVASPESPTKGDLFTRVAYQRGRDLSQNGYG